MFSTHYFSFCTDIITKVYKHYPTTPTDWKSFHYLSDLFLFLHKFPPEYTNNISPHHIKECKRLLSLPLDEDCYLYIVHSFYKFTQYIPHLDLNSFTTPIDYGFHTDTQNSITYIILQLLLRCTKFTKNTLITQKDALFIQDIMCPKLREDVDTITSLQIKLNDIFISHDLYVLPDAMHIVTLCWDYIHRNPLSLRIFLLYYTLKNENS